MENEELRVGPDLRQIDEDGVAALDAALREVASGEVLHLVDPQRVNAFSSGGPPVWSVAFAPVGEHVLFVTYGNSERIDRDSVGVSFELSMLVPARTAGAWVGRLLNDLVETMTRTGHELAAGEFTTATIPGSRMDAVGVVADPVLTGPIEVRRVVGIFPEERELVEAWSLRGLMAHLPAALTDIHRKNLADDASFVRAMEEGSRREGSDFGSLAVAGLRWSATDSACTIVFPAGAARRIHRMLRARLAHGKELLIYDTSEPRSVRLHPGTDWEVSFDEDVVIVTAPVDAPEVAALADPIADGIVWEIAKRP